MFGQQVMQFWFKCGNSWWVMTSTDYYSSLLWVTKTVFLISRIKHIANCSLSWIICAVKVFEWIWLLLCFTVQLISMTRCAKVTTGPHTGPAGCWPCNGSDQIPLLWASILNESLPFGADSLWWSSFSKISMCVLCQKKSEGTLWCESKYYGRIQSSHLCHWPFPWLVASMTPKDHTEPHFMECISWV